MIDWILVLAVAVALTIPANWFIRTLLVRIRAVPTGGSVGAGRWIGILERLLIFLPGAHFRRDHQHLADGRRLEKGSNDDRIALHGNDHPG